MSRIVTELVASPIPTRAFDWCAYRDGEEERGRYGYGRTEKEAIAALLDRDDDDDRDLFDRQIARLRREVREAERAHRGVGRARRKLSAAIHERMRRDAGR